MHNCSVQSGLMSYLIGEFSIEWRGIFMAQETKVNALPSRSEIAAEDTWRLEDIFATEEDWEACLQSSEGRPQESGGT